MNPKIITASVIALMLIGCATTEPTVVVVETPLIHPPLPRKLSLKPVEWEIINVNTNSYFALDAENYGNLSKNIADVTGYIEKLRVIIQYYHYVKPDSTNTTSTNNPAKPIITTKTNTVPATNGNWFSRTFGNKSTKAPSK